MLSRGGANTNFRRPDPLSQIHVQAEFGVEWVFARSSTTPGSDFSQLESLRAKHVATKELAASASNTLSPPDDLAMTVALFDAAMLATGPLARVYAVLATFQRRGRQR